MHRKKSVGKAFGIIMQNGELPTNRSISESTGRIIRARGARRRGSRAKRWCYTINNFSANDILKLRQLGRDGRQYPVLAFGREGRFTGTPHVQGYIELAKRVRLSQLRAILSHRAHYEVARGTRQDNINYISKEGDFEVYGDIDNTPGQGHRTDLEVIKGKLDNGVCERDIASDHFQQWVLYRRSFTAYRNLLSQPRNFASNVVVYWGATGVGKTRRVYEQCAGDLWTLCDLQGRWFDGYCGQSSALFDDFAGGIEFRFLLLLLDRYPLSVPIKGGFTNWAPRNIFITSNVSPTDWYPMLSEEQKAPLFRRIADIVEMT